MQLSCSPPAFYYFGRGVGFRERLTYEHLLSYRFSLAGDSFEDTLISSNEDRSIHACDASVIPISRE